MTVKYVLTDMFIVYTYQKNPSLSLLLTATEFPMGDNQICLPCVYFIYYRVSAFVVPVNTL